MRWANCAISANHSLNHSKTRLHSFLGVESGEKKALKLAELDWLGDFPGSARFCNLSSRVESTMYFYRFKNYDNEELKQKPNCRDLLLSLVEYVSLFSSSSPLYQYFSCSFDVLSLCLSRLFVVGLFCTQINNVENNCASCFLSLGLMETNLSFSIPSVCGLSAATTDAALNLQSIFPLSSTLFPPSPLLFLWRWIFLRNRPQPPSPS